jgi:hypothetical protein
MRQTAHEIREEKVALPAYLRLLAILSTQNGADTVSVFSMHGNKTSITESTGGAADSSAEVVGLIR